MLVSTIRFCTFPAQQEAVAYWVSLRVTDRCLPYASYFALWFMFRRPLSICLVSSLVQRLRLLHSPQLVEGFRCNLKRSEFIQNTSRQL